MLHRKLTSSLTCCHQDSKKSSSGDASHDQWTQFYKQFYGRPYTKLRQNHNLLYQIDHKTTTKSYSLPVTTHVTNSTSTLRYVLPIERAETLASINLKRSRSVAKPKQRLINYKAAKDHYINAQLMKKEGSFVSWEKAT